MQQTNSQSDNLISLLERRISDVKNKERDIEAKMEILKTELESVRGEASDYQRALVREQQRVGIGPVSQQHSVTREDPKGTIFCEFAVERGPKGFQVADVFALFRDRGTEIGKNYPYYLVSERYKGNLGRKGQGRHAVYYWTGTASD